MASFYSSASEMHLQWRSGDSQEGSEQIHPSQEKNSVAADNEPGPSQGRCGGLIRAPNYLYSSDEEADYLEDLHSLTKQLDDINIAKKKEFPADQAQAKALKKWIAEGKKLFCQQNDMEMDEMSDEDSEENELRRLKRELHPSGLTTAGPLMNADGNPRSLTRRVTYGHMDSTHEINVTDGIDECCGRKVPDLKCKLGATKRTGTLQTLVESISKNPRTKSLSLFGTKAMTLPCNMPKWAKVHNTSDSIISSAATVMSRGRSVFKTTSEFFRPLLKGRGDSKNQSSKTEQETNRLHRDKTLFPKSSKENYARDGNAKLFNIEIPKSNNELRWDRNGCVNYEITPLQKNLEESN